MRSLWRAEVKLHAWENHFEIRHRRIVPAGDLLAQLWIEDGFEVLYHRVLIEAGLLT